MTNEELYIQADRYLTGQMNPAEKADFDALLSGSAELQAEFNACKAAQSIIVDKALIDIKSEISSYHHSYRKQKQIRNYSIGGGIAAALIIVAVSVINFNDDENKLVVTEPATTVLRDSATTVPASMNENSGQQLVSTEKTSIKTKSENIQHTNTSLVPNNTDHDKISIPVADQKTVKDSTPAKKTETKISDQVPVGTENETPAITAGYHTKDACVEKNDGEITVVKTSIKGGTAPYSFSIDNTSFSSYPLFSGLEAGTYTLYIKDKNNYVSQITNIIIKSHYCDNEFVISPYRGENWVIPFHHQSAGEIIIINKVNQTIYSKKISSGDFWNGTDNQGNQQSAGLYKFSIRYENGEVFNGFITIIE